MEVLRLLVLLRILFFGKKCILIIFTIIFIALKLITNMSSSSQKPIQSQNNDKNTQKNTPLASSVAHQQDTQVIHSLLDVTYPYYNKSMFSKSTFHGFEVLLFMLAVSFCIGFTITNYLKRGQPLKWDVLFMIGNNLVWDGAATLTFFLLSLLQVKVGKLLLKIFNKTTISVYCLIWLIVMVNFGIWVIGSRDFYFTDRIFIVVLSWALSAKTGSYCLDQFSIAQGDTQLKQKQKKLQNFYPNFQFLLIIKFMVSPEIVYSSFLDKHNPKLQINRIYLSIKAVVSTGCLLINYLLITEAVIPLLSKEIHQKMSFPQLCFRLLPPVFYLNICLYYLIMQNIVPALGELTQLKDRRSYGDWWNALNIHQFMEKWIYQINAFGNKYLTELSTKVRNILNLAAIFVMLFSIYGQKITVNIVIFGLVSNLSAVFLLGQNSFLKNNYLVHLLTISFTPVSLAMHLKYGIFQ